MAISQENSPNSMGSRFRGPVAVLTAALLWGSLGPAAALFSEGSGVQLAAWRQLIAAAALLVAVTATRGWSLWTRADVPALIAGSAAFAAYSALYFPAVHLTGVAVATVVSIGAAPLVAGLTHRVMGGRLSVRWILATTGAVVGMVLVVLPQSHHIGSILGAVLALLAAAAYAWQAHAIGQMSGRHKPMEIMAAQFAGSAVLLSPVAVTGADVARGGHHLAALLYIALVATAFAYTLFAIGVPLVGPHTSVSLSLIEPVVAAAIAAVALHQALTTIQIVGMAVTLGALFALGTGSDNSQESPHSPNTEA